MHAMARCLGLLLKGIVAAAAVAGVGFGRAACEQEDASKHSLRAGMQVDRCVSRQQE